MNAWVKKVILLFLVMIFSIIVVSCSEEDNITNTPESQLTINLMYSDKVLLNAVEKYNNVNPNLKIDAKVFSDIEQFKDKNISLFLPELNALELLKLRDRLQVCFPKRIFGGIWKEL